MDTLGLLGCRHLGYVFTCMGCLGQFQGTNPKLDAGFPAIQKPINPNEQTDKTFSVLLAHPGALSYFHLQHPPVYRLFAGKRPH